MLSESQIGAIVKNELDAALSYEGEIAKKRAKLLDYYNAQPYGDEIDGQSSAVTTDVADVVEWMLPSLLRVFTQGKNIATFSPNRVEDEEEAEQKTLLANDLFLARNDGVRILHDMFKDALLQYTGTVKVFWDETEDTRITSYQNLSELEYQKLLVTPGVEIDEVEIIESEVGENTYNAQKVEVTTTRGIQYVNVPPEEFLISKAARDFERPVFIGQRSPYTRSDLVKMGFDPEVVKTLPADEWYEYTDQKNARYHDYDNWQDVNAGRHHPNDIVYLGEYYMEIDVNEDGVSEYWQVFYGGEKVLEKEQVEDHPFCVCVPVPIPHRAIGTCPAEQVADLQFRKSTLVRQLLNNVYQTNFPRVLHSNKAELDDLLTPRAGGLIGVDTDTPDVQGHVFPLAIQSQIAGIMTAIEYTDTEREVRTGITRYNQGLDAESLNKTATGFLGIKDASQQRLDLIARLFADGGVKHIFEKTVELLGKYQDEVMAVRVTGETLEIDPRNWSENQQCRIDVGIGAGDRQEKIINLNNILTRQLEFMERGLLLSDQAKIFHTMDRLVTEVGLKDANVYFNDPEIPDETLMAQNQQLVAMVQQFQSQQNPLAEAQMIEARARLIEAQSKGEREMTKFVMEQAQKSDEFRANLAKELTELELKYEQDVPGSAV